MLLGVKNRKMKLKNVFKLTLGLILGLGISNSAVCQETENSLLYKVEGKGIKTSYLFGTIHVMPNTDFELKEKVEEAFTASELVVLEIDMDDPSLPLEMMQNSMMIDGSTLDKLFSEEDYKKLDEELLATLGVSVSMFNKMKPFIVSSMLLSKYVGDQPASFEGTFVEMAAKQKKEILGLETVAEQMAVFDKISYKTQADQVSEMLNEDEETKELFKAMVEAYKQEDAEALYDFLVENHDGTEEELDYMLDDRNEKWIPKFKELSADKKVFYGVGAGHLGGDKGVLNLLEKAGYTVTPL